jgi:hypothetical protein
MVDASGQTPEFAETVDGAAITAGLPSLRHAPLPAGTREIRLWAGFGNTEPSGMIELVQQGNAVSGLVLHWFSSPSEFDTLLPGNRDHAVRFVHRMNECNDIRQRDADSTDEHGVYHWVTCATARMGAPKLDRLWRAIDSLGVWSLPPESTLIQYGGLVHTDGTSLLVELRDGDQYRTYVYSDPQDQPSPQAAAADGILRLVLAATRFTLRPSADSAQ